MITRDQWRRFIDHPVVEWSIFGIGVILIAISPVLGALPGPGGIFVFALGLAMVLKTSRWARRHYVKFKRWQPKAGRWTDWGLRRKSAARREALRKQREQLGCDNPPGVEAAGDDVSPEQSMIPGPPAKASD
jgi:hypothetical protein